MRYDIELFPESFGETGESWTFIIHRVSVDPKNNNLVIREHINRQGKFNSRDKAYMVADRWLRRTAADGKLE